MRILVERAAHELSRRGLAPCWGRVWSCRRPDNVAGGLLHDAAPLRPPCVRFADLRAGVRFGRAGAAAACARLSGSVGPAASASHLSAAARGRAGRPARAGLADGDGLFVQPADARAHALAHLVYAALWVRRTAAATSPAQPAVPCRARVTAATAARPPIPRPHVHRAGRALLLLAKQNADKAVVGASLVQRMQMMELLAADDDTGRTCCGLTGHALFVDKAAALQALCAPGARVHMLVGFDTWIRITDPKYYSEGQVCGTSPPPPHHLPTTSPPPPRHSPRCYRCSPGSSPQ